MLTPIDGTPGLGTAETLGIKGAAIVFPTEVDMESPLRTVLDVGGGGWVTVQSHFAKEAATAIGGTSGRTVPIFGPAGYVLGGINVLAGVTNERNLRVIGTNMTLVFDAAGIAAFAGKRVQMRVTAVGPTATDTAQIETPVYTLVAGELTLRMAGAKIWPLPASWKLHMSVVVLDGTVYPANTTQAIDVVAISAKVTRQLAQ